MTKEISCRVTRTLIMYVREQNNGSLGNLLDGLELDESYLLDTNNWVSHSFLHVLYHRMVAILGDDNSVYKFALASGRLGSLGLLDGMARLLGNPKLLYSQAPKYNKLLKLNGDVHIHELGRSWAVIEDRYHNSAQKTKYDCDYTRGILTAIPTMFDLPPAQVEEIGCQVAADVYGIRQWPDTPAQNAAGCLYRIRWETRKKLLLGRRAARKAIEDLQEANRSIQDKYEEVKRLASDLQNANRQLRDSQRQLESYAAHVRASEERYRFLAGNISDTIWTFSLEAMRFTYISPSVRKIAGFTAEEAMQMGLEEMLTSQSFETVMKILEEELAKDRAGDADPNRHRTFEVQQLYKDGSYYWAEATMSFIRNEDGRPIGVLGVTRDISERKRVESVVAEQLKGLQFLSSSATRLLDPMPQRELFAYIARQLRAVTGRAIAVVTEYEPETNRIMVREVVGPDDRMAKLHRLLQRNPAELSFAVTEDLQRFMEKGRLVPVEGGVYRLVFGQLPRPLCTEIEEQLELGEIYGMSFVLGKDFMGTVIIGTERAEGLKNRHVIEALVNQGALAIKRKKTEEELRKSHDQLERKVRERTAELEESHERFRTLVELLPEMVFEADTHGRFTYANRQVLEAFNLTPEDFQHGLHIRDIIVEKDYRRVMENVNRILQGEVRQGGEYTVKRKDGSQFPAFIRASRIERNGQIVGLRGIVWDRTESLKAEAERTLLEEQLHQSQKMEAIGTLAGGIAHDFNNMLAVIIGNAELALDDIREERPKGNLKQILDASRRSRDLVTQILTFSRKSEGERKSLKLTPLIKETVKLLRGSLPSTINIKTDIRTDMDTVLGNPSQMQQILVNLATNAAQAIGEDGGMLGIRLSEAAFNAGDPMPDRDMKPGRYVKLTVRDTGGGIPAEIRKRIFDPFFTTKEPGQGTGMGLAVVFGIVKSHGGAISVDSKVGRGSVFNIFLPSADCAVGEESHSQDPVPKGKERLLVIDDEPYVLDIASETLQRLGYHVTTARNGGEGWKMFEENPHGFELVITDQVMPELTGMKLAEKMLEQRKDVPIVLMTGYSETASPESVRAAGIREILMKPIEKRVLAETVRRILDERNKDL